MVKRRQRTLQRLWNLKRNSNNFALFSNEFSMIILCVGLYRNHGCKSVMYDTLYSDNIIKSRGSSKWENDNNNACSCKQLNNVVSIYKKFTRKCCRFLSYDRFSSPSKMFSSFFLIYFFGWKYLQNKADLEVVSLPCKDICLTVAEDIVVINCLLVLLSWPFFGQSFQILHPENKVSSFANMVVEE